MNHVTPIRFLGLVKRLLLLTLTTVLLTACGGGGSGAPPGGGGNAFVLQAKVYQVPTNGTVTITSTSATSVVLTGPVPATVDTGWTLIGNVPGKTQFLRKVTGMSKAGNVVTFQTQAAQLTDIFNDAQIHNIQTMAGSVLATMKPAQPGITITSLSRGRDISYSNELAFDKVAVSDAGGLNSVGEVNGKIDYSFGFETALDVGVHGIFDLRPKINKFRVAPFLRANGQLTVTGKTHGAFTKQIPIGLPISFPVASLGPVPINISLQLNLELDGRLDINGSLKVTGSIDMSAGIDCTNDNWSTIQTFNHTFNVTPPNLQATATLTLSAMQPQVGIGIPDIGNMYVRADVLKADVTFAFQTQPLGYSITSSGDFKFTAGGTIKLGPITFFDGQVGAFDLGSFKLGDPIFLPAAPSTISYWYIPGGGASRAVYTTDGNGTSGHNVLNNATRDQAQPDLSYDGTKIVYTSAGSLYVCNVNGSNDHKVMDASAVPGFGVDYPSWSPDGTKIAFDAGVGGNNNLYVVSSSGGTPQKVGDLTYESYSPRFSPDGSKLVYNHSSGDGTYQIYQLTLSTNKSTLLVGPGSHWHPSYSPDGTTIVCTNVVNGEIDIVDYQGIGITRILNDDYYTFPRFSPDGSRLVFEKGFFPAKLGTCTVDGKNVTLFSLDLGSSGGYPSWH